MNNKNSLQILVGLKPTQKVQTKTSESAHKLKRVAERIWDMTRSVWELAFATILLANIMYWGFTSIENQQLSNFYYFKTMFGEDSKSVECLVKSVLIGGELLLIIFLGFEIHKAMKGDENV